MERQSDRCRRTRRGHARRRDDLAAPVRGADAVSSAISTGDVEPFMRAIGSVIFDALRGLFGYL
jgi:DNA-binding IclR family transcriptional regulator